MKIALLLVLFALLMACDKPSVSSAQKTQTSLQEKPCWSLVDHDGVVLRCYVWREPGRDHHTRVALISNRRDADLLSASPQQELLVYLPGGPGQGAMTGAWWLQHWLDWYKQNKPGVDLLLIDPSATPGSSAYWACAEYEQQSVLLMAKDLTLEQEVTALDPILNQCLDTYHQRLISQGFSKQGLASLNSRAYRDTLWRLFDDIDYRSIHLWGASYGSRLAMLSAGHSKVKTVFLDSAYPVEFGGMADEPMLMKRSFLLHQELANLVMGPNYDYLAVYRSAQEKLRKAGELAEKTGSAHAYKWNIRRLDGNGVVSFVLNEQRLEALHINQLYDVYGIEQYYLALQDLHVNDKNLIELLEYFVTNVFDPEFSSLTYLATECHDNRRIKQADFLLNAEMDDVSQADWSWWWQTDICRNSRFSGVQPLQPDDINIGDKPLLISGGHFDLVTPFAWSDMLLTQHSHAQALEFAQQGHTAFSYWPCHMQALTLFWQTGSLRDFRCEMEGADIFPNWQFRYFP